MDIAELKWAVREAADNTPRVAERLLIVEEILSAVEDYDLLESRFEMLGAVWNYYIQTKGKGHTRLMRDGLINFCKPHNDSDFQTKAAVMIATSNQRSQFPDNYCLSFEELKEGRGNGLRVPLAWDNAAIIRLCSMMMIVQGTFRRIRNLVEGER